MPKVPSTSVHTRSIRRNAHIFLFFSVLSSSGEDKKVLIDGVKKLLKEKNTVKGTGTKPKALPKGALDDDDTPIESVYFSPGNKKNK